VGSSGIAVGRHLVDNMDRMPGAHRVLRSDGRVADNFRWPRNADRGDIYDVLRAEGISISDGGTADPVQRLTSQDLFDLLNLGEEQGAPGKDDGRRQGRFWEQIELAMDSDEVSRLKAVLDAWVLGGGRLTYGKADQVSCFLELQRPDAPITWPIVVYPHPGGARIEVVFQHLAKRPPFVDAALRNEFRERLNRLDGVSIPEAKLMLRPNFPFSVIDSDGQVDLLIVALSWFRTASMESEN
jgi:hypothetical protein